MIAVVGELEPAAAWAQTDADRFVAVDELAAVALADAGVEGDRILVVGAIGERAFADAGAQDRAALRTRFKLRGKVALVEVAGLGAELTGQLALQLSLLDAARRSRSCSTPPATSTPPRCCAARSRRSACAASCSARPPMRALLWRAADVIVARPRPETVARVLLVGGKLVALIDDQRRRPARSSRPRSKRASARSRRRAC